MSDDAKNTTPETVDPTVTSPAESADAGTPAASETAATTDDAAPTWDGEFDADRAARLVANLRSEKAALKSELAEVKKALSEKEEASTAELQRLLERSEKAERELNELRTKSLISAQLREHGLPEDLAEFVPGGTEEEIVSRVAKLAEKFGPKPLAGKPRAKLVPGEGGEVKPSFDPEAIAEKIRKSL